MSLTERYRRLNGRVLFDGTLLTIAILAASFTLSNLPAAAADATDGRSPNVLLILVDDLGYGDLGCYGAKDMDTPHLDKLASGGVRLTDFYVACPICASTRASLMTGRYPERLPKELIWDTWRGLPLEEVTLADVMKKAGYTTGLVGKWHLGRHDPEFHPLSRGFDEFYGILTGGATYYEHVYPRAEWKTMYRGFDPFDEPGHLTDLLTREAVAFLDRHRADRFFLYLAYNAPHAPWEAPEEYVGRSRRGVYGALVSHLDAGIGRVLDRLKEFGLEEDTLVIFLSDNGGCGREHNAPLSGGKANVREGGIRVPCIARWPGRIPAGSVVKEPAISMDLFTTIATAGSGSLPDDVAIDGKDILPLMQGKAKSPHECLFWSFSYISGKPVPKRAAVRRGRWKLLASKGKITLHDLETDVSESRDVSAAHPEVVRDLSDRLKHWEGNVEYKHKLGSNGYFQTEDGKPFVALGVVGNLIPIDIAEVTSPEQPLTKAVWWDQATDEELCAYFEFLREQGANTVRLSPFGTRHLGDPPLDRANLPKNLPPVVHQMDVFGKANLDMVAFLSNYLKIAQRYGVHVHLLLFFRARSNPYVGNVWGQDLIRDALDHHWSKEELRSATPAQKRFLERREVIKLCSPAWAEVDLGEVKRIDTIRLWHLAGRQFHENRVAISATGQFAGEEEVVFDSATDGEYEESAEGKTIRFKPVEGRFVRNWLTGSLMANSKENPSGCWHEIQVFDSQADPGKNLALGKPVKHLDRPHHPGLNPACVTDGKMETGLHTCLHFTAFRRDPDVIDCQKRYLSDLLPRLRDNPAIAAYYMQCEMPQLVEADLKWYRDMIAHVRAADPNHLMGSSHAVPPGCDPFHVCSSVDLDFYTYSIYPEHWERRRSTQLTTDYADYGLMQDTIARYNRLLGTPAMASEAGHYGPTRHIRGRGRVLAVRDVIWFGLLSQSPGAVWYYSMVPHIGYPILGEFQQMKPASQIIGRFKPWTITRLKPAVCVELKPNELGRCWETLLRYDRYFLDRGIDFDIAFDATGYAQRLPAEEFTEPAGPAEGFTPSNGYQVKYLMAEDRSRAIVFVRNCVEVERHAETKNLYGVETDYVFHTRKTGHRKAAIQLDLPKGDYTIQWTDLDTGASRSVSSTGRGELVLSESSEDDFVVVIERN